MRADRDPDDDVCVCGYKRRDHPGAGRCPHTSSTFHLDRFLTDLAIPAGWKMPSAEADKQARRAEARKGRR